MAGRRPKPSHLKLLEGTARPDRARTAEPQPPDGEVQRPAFLKGRAATLWNQYAPACEKMGTLTVVDVPTMAAWCVLMANFERKGAAMQASQIAQMRLLGDALGMSASARAKIGTGGEKPSKDPADAYFG